MAGVEQNRYKTNSGCIKHLPQTGWLIKVSEQFHAVLLLAAFVFLLTKQALKLSLKYFQKIIKQLLNSVLVGYEELLRPRFVVSASAFGR